MLGLLVTGAMLAGPDLAAYCADGDPILAVATQPGLGPGPDGVVVALWPDGVVLRAGVSSDPGKGHVYGNLSAADQRAAIRFIDSTGVWTWKQPKVVVDAAENLLVVCAGEHRHSWHETEGMHPESPLPTIRSYLLRLPFAATINPDTTQPAHWRKWFERQATQAQAKE